jgi:hypothetical protein
MNWNRLIGGSSHHGPAGRVGASSATFERTGPLAGCEPDEEALLGFGAMPTASQVS